MPQVLSEAWQTESQKFKTLGDPQLETMLRQATEFVTDIVCKRTPPHWISFLGPSGTGKTTLGRRIMSFIRQHCLRFSPGYGITLTENLCVAKWPKMIAEMKGGDFDTVENLCEKETKWDQSIGMTYAYAMIDDIGQVEDTQKRYLISNLGRIADSRLRSWTVWTSNLTLEQLSDIDPRISSRMIREENVVVINDCEDFNLRNCK